MKVLITKGSHKGTVAEVVERYVEGTGFDPIYALKDKDGQKIWNGQLTYFDSDFITELDVEVETPHGIEPKEYVFNPQNWGDEAEVRATLNADGSFIFYGEAYEIVRSVNVQDYTEQFNKWDESATDTFVTYRVYEKGQGRVEPVVTVLQLKEKDYHAEEYGVVRTGTNAFVVACLILANII